MALMRQLGDFIRSHKKTIGGEYFGAADLKGTELESAAFAGRLHSPKEDLPERPFVLQSKDFPPLPNHRAPPSKSRTTVRTSKTLVKKGGRRPASRRSQGPKKNRRKAKRNPQPKVVPPPERASPVSRFIYLKLSLSPDAAPVACIPKTPNPPVRNPSNPQSVPPFKTATCCQSECAKASGRGPLPTGTAQSQATSESTSEPVSAPSYLQVVLSTASKAVRSALRKAGGSLVSLCTWVLGPHSKTAHPLQRSPGFLVEKPVPS